MSRYSNEIQLNNRYAYDPNATYCENDYVWYTANNITYRYVYQGRDPITGVAPTTRNSGWVRDMILDSEPVMGARGRPAPNRMVRYVESDGTTTRPNYVDRDEFEEISDDGGTTWTRRRIRGGTGPKGDTPVVRQPADGDNAPLLMWQFAPEPEPNQQYQPTDFGVPYLAEYRHIRFYNGLDHSSWLPIIGQDGRDGLDLHMQFSNYTPADGETLEDTPASQIELVDTGQNHARMRIGTRPWGRWFTRAAAARGMGLNESEVRSIVNNRFTDEEKAKLAGIEERATRDQTVSEIRTLLGLSLAVQNKLIKTVVQSGDNNEILTITFIDDSTQVITLPVFTGMGGNPVSAVAFDSTTQVLTVTLTDGSSFTADLSSLSQTMPLDALTLRVAANERAIAELETKFASVSDRTDAQDSEIRGLTERTVDLDVLTDVVWANTTEAAFSLFDRTSQLTTNDLSSATYRSMHAIGSGEIDRQILVLRVPTGNGTKPYRITETGKSPFTSVGFARTPRASVGGFDYFLHGGLHNFDVDDVLQVQKTTEIKHTKYEGELKTDRVRDALGNLLPRIYSVNTDPASIDERQLDRNYRFIVYLPANAIPGATKVRIVFNGVEGNYQTHNQTATRVNLTMGLNDTQMDALKRAVITQQFVGYEIQFANAADEIVWRHPGNIAIDPSYLPVEISDDEIAQDLSDADLTDVIRSFTAHKIWDIVQKGINAIASRLLPTRDSANFGLTTDDDGNWITRQPQTLIEARQGHTPWVVPQTPVNVRETALGMYYNSYSLDPTVANLHIRYNIIAYDETRWNANDLPDDGIMFNNTDTRQATQVKIKYAAFGRDVELINGLEANHRLEVHSFRFIRGYEDLHITWSGTISAVSIPVTGVKLFTINTVGAVRGRITIAQNQRVGIACTNPEVNNEVTREVASAATMVKQGTDLNVETDDKTTWHATGFTVTAGKLMYIEFYDPRSTREEADTQNSIIPSWIIITDNLIALPKRADNARFQGQQAHVDLTHEIQGITDTSNQLLIHVDRDNLDAFPMRVYYYE